MTEKIHLHTAYERLWHWWQAAAVCALLLTGAEIHWPSFELMGFETATLVHDVIGLLLLSNAFLGLFYALASGGIRAYLPEPRDFMSLAIRQVTYYVRGIFDGAPHPIAKRPERRLNPLQQVTYLAILNVLLPLQVVTGVLMGGASWWPEVVAALGGMPMLAGVHTAAAWAFAVFIVGHVYLTTTAGPTWSAGIVGMITGWEPVEREPEKEASS